MFALDNFESQGVVLYKNGVALNSEIAPSMEVVKIFQNLPKNGLGNIYIIMGFELELDA